MFWKQICCVFLQCKCMWHEFAEIESTDSAHTFPFGLCALLSVWSSAPNFTRRITESDWFKPLGRLGPCNTEEDQKSYGLRLQDTQGDFQLRVGGLNCKAPLQCVFVAAETDNTNTRNRTPATCVLDCASAFWAESFMNLSTWVSGTVWLQIFFIINHLILDWDLKTTLHLCWGVWLWKGVDEQD